MTQDAIFSLVRKQSSERSVTEMLYGTHMCAAEEDVQGRLQPNPSLLRLVVVAERYRRTETAEV